MTDTRRKPPSDSREPTRQRRLLSGTAALTVHGALLATLLLGGPTDRGPGGEAGGGGAGGVVDVRLYTVAGLDAVTDAPLNEPMIGETDPDGPGRPGDVVPGPGNSRGTADASSDPEPVPQTPEPVEAPPDDSPPEPEDRPVDAADSGSASADLPAEAAVNILTAPGSGNAPIATPSSAGRQTPARQAVPFSGPGDPDRPVTTTQLARPDERVSISAPTFAGILARAAPELNLTEFDIAALIGGTDAMVRETLCLSSSAAMLEAADCPPGPNANQAALAAYGLSEPGERPPVFPVDMGRLAFRMQQLGASPSAIDQILLGLEEARREAINTPALSRQMSRDAASRTDHLGVGGPITPANGRDPSDGG